MADIKEFRKVRIHTVYKNAEGERLPSVTTVLGILAKPALIDWAYNFGVNGIDYRKARDAAGDIGTLVHYLILCDLKGEKPDLSGYSTEGIDRAETCLIKYWDWQKAHKLIPMLCETPMVDSDNKFGGTPDWYGEIDGVPTLVDFKSGKGIYDEFMYQLGAYVLLLVANGKLAPKEARILRIGRDDAEGYEEKVITEFGRYQQIFLSCLNIYNLRKEK